MGTEHTLAQFLAELALLLLCGRLLGEGLNRIGQPAIFGQLLAGVALGPSVFGVIAPGAHHAIFAGTPTLKAMIDALSQVGILMLLLLTGMETNLALVNRKRRAVISTSLVGVAVPFACGVAVTYALPANLIPNNQTLVSALFLGVALSVSSVKIVAMVLIDVGAIRRDIGQLILATAILDDTIAWVLIAVIAGIAAHHAVDFKTVGVSLGGALLFLAVSLTVGRGLVARAIRMANDYMTIEVPVITAILIIMLLMAVTTDLLGVQTELGAFVAGLLIGQSPILTDHIERELRGFILAFFSPIFFAVAGLGLDLSTLANTTLLGFLLAIIAIATFGKFLGAGLGGLIAGLSLRESAALATGLNARGSTEVIVATIGLSMGAISSQIYTMIVAMAVVTTMAMPPTLRWMLVRVTPNDEEQKRLEKEVAEESESVPKMERALVCLDDSANARLAARIAGAFAGGRQVLTTLMGINIDDGPKTRGHERDAILEAAKAAIARAPADRKDATDDTPPIKLNDLVQTKATDSADAIAKEATKGYSIAFAGVEQPTRDLAHRFDQRLQALIDAFNGPVAIAMNGERFDAAAGRPLRILVPTGGAPHARLATEVALALAKATGGSLTVFYVFEPDEDVNLLRSRGRRFGMSVLADARLLGRRNDVPVRAISATDARPEEAIRHAVANGGYDLVIFGAVFRVGERKFLGPRSSAMTRAMDGPFLLIAQ